jgi:hypothetical protein
MQLFKIPPKIPPKSADVNGPRWTRLDKINIKCPLLIRISMASDSNSNRSWTHIPIYPDTLWGSLSQSSTIHGF